MRRQIELRAFLVSGNLSIVKLEFVMVPRCKVSSSVCHRLINCATECAQRYECLANSRMYVHCTVSRRVGPERDARGQGRLLGALISITRTKNCQLIMIIVDC